MAGRRLGALGVVALLVLPSAATATVAPPSLAVAVIRPTGDDPVLAEAAGRLGAELSAAGMRADVVACAAGFDPQCPRPADPADTPDAAVAILRLPGMTAIEVKVTNDRALHVLVRRMDISPDRGGGDPSVVAIRAVELLRATLMQQTAESRPPPGEIAAAQVEEPGVAAPAGPRASWAVAAGAALLQSRDGLGGAFGPQARVALRPYRSIGFEAKVATLVWAPDLTARAGSASLQQELGDAGVTYAVPLGRRLIPMVSAGLGAYHIAVTGHSSIDTAQAKTPALWAAEIEAGLGLLVILRAEYALRFDAAAVLIAPSPYVTIGAANAFHAGRPLLLFGLTIERGLPDVWGALFQ